MLSQRPNTGKGILVLLWNGKRGNGHIERWYRKLLALSESEQLFWRVRTFGEPVLFDARRRSLEAARILLVCDGSMRQVATVDHADASQDAINDVFSDR